MSKTYITKATCSSKIHFNVEDNLVKDVSFESGCPGNLLRISSLVEGMHISDVISKLRGIPCGQKGTSCPDQLARALEQYQAL